MKPGRALASLAAAAASLAACVSATASPPPPASIPPRATPYASVPAAGICGEAPGSEVLMRLEPGIPDPRCVIVRSSQVLRVANHTGAAVTVTLGEESYNLQPEAEVLFATAFGDALLPGVHLLAVDPCCGGELWLQTE